MTRVNPSWISHSNFYPWFLPVRAALFASSLDLTPSRRPILFFRAGLKKMPIIMAWIISASECPPSPSPPSPTCSLTVPVQLAAEKLALTARTRRWYIQKNVLMLREKRKRKRRLLWVNKLPCLSFGVKLRSLFAWNQISQPEIKSARYQHLSQQSNLTARYQISARKQISARAQNLSQQSNLTARN